MKPKLYTNTIHLSEHGEQAVKPFVKEVELLINKAEDEAELRTIASLLKHKIDGLVLKKIISKEDVIGIYQ